jgi:protein-S-isoprenylcysteine O-methyltransferase Ste14
MSLPYLLLTLFTVAEVLLLIFKRSKALSVKSNADRRSLLLFWVTIPVCLTAGSVMSDWQIGLIGNAQLLKNIGLAIFVIGFSIRWIAIFQLGSMFTVDVSISSMHILKTNGLYQFARHPSYLGLLLILAGISFFMNNWLSSLVVMIPIFLVTNYRIAVEEESLIAEFGSTYTDYKKRVKRIFP